MHNFNSIETNGYLRGGYTLAFEQLSTYLLIFIINIVVMPVDNNVV